MAFIKVLVHNSLPFTNEITSISMGCKLVIIFHVLSLSTSSANAKKWEVELQTLKNNNARLTTALQESTTNVEEWKKQLAAYKEESARMKKRVRSLVMLYRYIKKSWFHITTGSSIFYYVLHHDDALLVVVSHLCTVTVGSGNGEVWWRI